MCSVQGSGTTSSCPSVRENGASVVPLSITVEVYVHIKVLNDEMWYRCINPSRLDYSSNVGAREEASAHLREARLAAPLLAVLLYPVFIIVRLLVQFDVASASIRSV